MHHLTGDTARKPEVPTEIKARWQRIVDLASELLGVPAALINRFANPEIEMFLASATEGNPYRQGDRARLAGLYCEKVMRTWDTLLVPDALADPAWAHNPALAEGMTYCLGYPLRWPDGEIFGTICVLDRKDNPRATHHHELLAEFQQAIEADLRLLAEHREREELLADLQRQRYRLTATVAERTAAWEMQKGCIEERDKLEDLLTDLSTRFIAIPPETVQSEITAALVCLCAFLGTDRCALFQVRNAHRHIEAVHVGHSVADHGDMADVIQPSLHPWAYHRLVKEKQAVIFSTLADLPAAAHADRTQWEKEGVHAMLMLPLIPRGEVSHIVGLWSGKNPWEWQSDHIRSITLLGNIFAKSLLHMHDEDARNRSERRLAEAQRVANVGSWEWQDGSLDLEWSDQAFRLFGFTPRAFQSTYETFMGAIHPDDRERVQDALIAALSYPEKTYSIEYRVVYPDGSEHILHGRGEVVFDRGGKPTSMIGTVHDITESKHAEEAVQRNSRRLAEAQRIAHMGNWEWDIGSGECSAWSDEIYRILGFPPQAFPAGLESFLASVHADDRRRLQETLREALAVPGKNFSIEYRIVRPDGTERIVYAQGETRFDRDRNPVRMVGTIQDITESRRAEDLLLKSSRNLAEAQRIAHLGHWEWNGGQTELDWSDEVYRIFGFSPQDHSATLDDFFTAIHIDDREHVQEALFAALAGPSKSIAIEHRIVRTDGSERVVYAQGNVSFDGDGNPVRVFGTVQDVTERKRTEIELTKALEQNRRLAELLEAENIYLRDEVATEGGPWGIIGSSNVIRYVLFRVQQVARTEATVLLTGETGTGKGVFARAIHEASNRKDKPFVHVNCAGLPANLIESELFGREKGAFTGSTARQIGRFELANGGTIFLDEIGELPLELQAKLLKVIEDGEFERLGDPHPVKVDVRIIASTNRHLGKEIRGGRFRMDLFYRLNVFPVTIPPLRHRKEDIPHLAKFYTDRFGKKHGKDIRRIPRQVMKTLENYEWPGNVRELINIIERSVILSQGPELRLAEKIQSLPLDSLQEKRAGGAGKGASRELADMERKHILAVLHETGWIIDGKKGAAHYLGMNPSTMRARMKKLGITRPEVH